MTGRLDWHHEGADWPHREASRFVEAGGLKWHVQIFGQGPSLLLLHGTGASTHSWRDVIPLLAPHFQLIVPDLPGHAFTDPLPESEAGLPGMAKAVAALLTALDAEVDLVIGHSAGAAIAIRMALDGSVTPQAIVGINAALVPFGGAAERIFPPLARLLTLNPFVPRFFTWQATDLAAISRLMESTGSRISSEGLAFYQRLFRSRDHIRATLAMMAYWDLASLRKAMPDLAVPLHLIVGLGDKAVSPEQARGLKQAMPSIRLHFLPGLGHLCHEEQPAKVVELVDRVAADHGLAEAA
ncbi:alpha/beta fold hydrolase BchO [Rhabdaerophilum sp. SD176]|uniref:alpha/beta fold hydrolase BchO n=1 Tax=Rhabdaerophilum sp. SD176 TaxID=2983548 RepID=UPI0024DF6CEB|nr:alpha/beta fold hydrolase BchO [Rhabdaerophilum sp. SD176]